MNGMQASDPHDAVELVENAVEVMDDVVTRIAHVAGVEAHAEFATELGTAGGNALDDPRKFLETASHLGPLARHGLEEHAGRLPFEHDLAERIDDKLDAGVDPLPHVRPGMEVVVVARKRLEPFEILVHGLERELAGALLGRAGVVGIGGVRDEFAEPVLIHEVDEPRDVSRVEFLGLAAARVAGEERKGVRPDRDRRLPHRGIAFGRGQMASDGQHGKRSSRFETAWSWAIVPHSPERAVAQREPTVRTRSPSTRCCRRPRRPSPSSWRTSRARPSRDRAGSGDARRRAVRGCRYAAGSAAHTCRTSRTCSQAWARRCAPRSP